MQDMRLLLCYRRGKGKKGPLINGNQTEPIPLGLIFTSESHCKTSQLVLATNKQVQGNLHLNEKNYILLVKYGFDRVRTISWVGLTFCTLESL